jgi:hypothetical protein
MKQVFYLHPDQPDPFLANQIIWLHIIDRVFIPTPDLIILIEKFYFPN